MRRTAIFFIFLLVLTGCSETVLVEEGVSKKLAQQRKESVSGLLYQLSFSIPDQKSEAVRGRVAISFENAASELPQVDFKAPLDHITSVNVNGVEVPWHFEKEHIVFESAAEVGPTVIDVQFVSPDQSLNRREELLYTLLVPDRARTLFPCFDQPDLKGKYTLSLEIPDKWVAVSNTSVASERDAADARKVVDFRESEPLSTYLFSFVVGDFKKESATRGDRTISMYYRETDPKKLAQIPDIFAEVFYSLDWLEDYTGIDYPFEKYDFIVLPGFQYGGMEHTGATLYNDGRIFMNEGAGINELMNRSQLIAHETAHMWFGDLVTMKWFDEVWTKEVFANYFAAQIFTSKYPEVDLGMNFADYARSSYSEDRTPGTVPIKQELDNLRNAGLVYGNIIYSKSPIVMEMLASKLGPEVFKGGIREYLSNFAYGNATWNDLVDIFDARSSENLRRWSEAWVDEKGMPTIGSIVNKDSSKVLVWQEDQWSRGVRWQQPITLRLIFTDGSSEITVADLRKRYVEVVPSSQKKVAHIVPNIDAKAYGYFETGDPDALAGLLLDSLSTWGPVEKSSTLINLNESYLHYGYTSEDFGPFLLRYLSREHDPLLFSQAIGYLSRVNLHDGVSGMDSTLLALLCSVQSDAPHLESCRRTAFSALVSSVRDTSITRFLYECFQHPDKFNSFKLTESNLTTLSYELSIRLPEKCPDILTLQRSRITDADRLSKFDFISRAVVPDEASLDSLFESLKEPSNRRIEPWTLSVLAYLNHPLRAERSQKYIIPALEELQEIQVTGDIFFPANWIRNLLAGHPEEQADILVASFFAAHPDYPPMLSAKIAQTRLP